MDTTSAVEVARRAGVSLPTAHKLLDREGIARTGRGVPRRVPREVAERIWKQHRPGLSESGARVLAALSISPTGLSSARQVARVAGVSPTTASSSLRTLVAAGVVQQNERRSVRAGRATAEQRFELNRRSAEWERVRPTVREVILPERAATPTDRVPPRFWHLFWNTKPAHLRISSDGAYIARRLLGSSSMAAGQWALTHCPAADLRAAVAGRGADERTRAMVQNWLVDKREH